jgi:hypothetical protein
MLNSPYKRSAHDDYPSPSGVIEPLLRFHPILTYGNIWEPFCGSGSLTRQMESHDISVLSTGLPEDDFFDYKIKPMGIDTIISNPPYKLTDSIIRHAFYIGIKRIALLLNFRFIAAKGRTYLREHLVAPVVLMGRLKMLPPGAEDKGFNGTEDFAWFVFSFEIAQKRMLVYQGDNCNRNEQ